MSVTSAVEFGATGEDLAEALKLPPDVGRELYEKIQDRMK